MSSKTSLESDSSVDKLVLLEEYRLVEKNESQVSLKWKGAHLLLFVLAVIFGSMCTFCLYMLAFMFDQNCVLFPQLLALDAAKHSFLLEFLPKDAETDSLPVDFLGIQWADDEECALPAFIPLCSAIFGLIWTTLFIMCSTGSESRSLQRPWRLMLPVLIFSLIMGGLCVYASVQTYNGLQQLCLTIGKFTGSEDCSYIMNVATLPYEGRIRGVFQAVRLTIITAWLHTSCWLLAAAVVLIRVVLAVDFQLVKVQAELRGDVEAMLERNEKLLRNMQFESGIAFDPVRQRWGPVPKSEHTENDKYISEKKLSSSSIETEVIYLSPPKQSPMPLTLDEPAKESPRVTFQETKNMLYDLVDHIPLKLSSVEMYQQSLETPSDPIIQDPEAGTSKGTQEEQRPAELKRTDSDSRHVSFMVSKKRKDQDQISSSNDSKNARKRKSKSNNMGTQTDKTNSATETSASLTGDESTSVTSRQTLKDSMSKDKKKD